MLAQLFGERIKYLRRINLLKQRELAQAAEICEQYLSRIELGQVSPSFQSIEKISHALHTEPFHLFFFPRSLAAPAAKPSFQPPQDEARLQTLPITLQFIGNLKITSLTQAHRWSTSIFRLLGYTTPVAPTTKRLLSHVQPDQRPELLRFLNSALRGPPPRDILFPFMRSTRRNMPLDAAWSQAVDIRWALLHAEPLAAFADGQEQLELTMLDVTDMLLLEQCLIRMHEELELRLSQKSDELARTRQQAQVESSNRIRLERELHRFQRTISASSDAQAFVDNDYVYRIANEAYLKLHGTREDQLLGRSTVDIHAQDIFARDVHPCMERALAGEYVSTLCWKDVPGAGQRQLLANCIPYRDESGISGLIITLHDVTEQHFLKSRLEFTEAQYRTIVELANEGIRIVDDQGVITYVNPKAAAMLGYKKEDLEGRPLIDFIHPEDIPAVLEHLEQRRQGLCSRYEIRQTHRTGRTIWVRVSACPLYNQDEYFGSLATITDITADKSREREMSCLQEVVAHSPVVAFVWRNDAQWSVEYVSENVETLLGWNKVDFLSGNLTYAELIHPKDKSFVKNEVDVYSLDPNLRSTKLSPYRVRTKSGRMVWVEEMTTFLRSEDGQVQGYEGFIHDVTVPKLREDIIRDSNTELTSLLHHCRQTITQAQTLPQASPEIKAILDSLRERLERFEKGAGLERDDGCFLGGKLSDSVGIG
ncbi:PAS domain S-box protein [Desulfonatronum sp. SC1]|uniref:PAS domain S-box protein n=1 Tax=Desulfonatronum sp. SC1 TaxID=2109626 RepID=UPI001304BFAC|nr:PAS domain S-box protein [Desulfonatronum sp. SC1]